MEAGDGEKLVLKEKLNNNKNYYNRIKKQATMMKS
jgi:hypothetical protein